MHPKMEVHCQASLLFQDLCFPVFSRLVVDLHIGISQLSVVTSYPAFFIPCAIVTQSRSLTSPEPVPPLMVLAAPAPYSAIFPPFFRRKKMLFVFQKNKSFCCRFPCKSAVVDLALCYFVGCCSAECSYFCFHLLLPPKLSVSLLSLQISPNIHSSHPVLRFSSHNTTFCFYYLSLGLQIQVLFYPVIGRY